MNEGPSYAKSMEDVQRMGKKIESRNAGRNPFDGFRVGEGNGEKEGIGS